MAADEADAKDGTTAAREERQSYGEPHTVPAVGIRTDVRPLGEDGGGW